MKADRKALLAAVEAAVKGISSRPGIPALTGVRVSVLGDRATFEGTDLELTITTQLDVQADPGESWVALIPGRLLVEVLKKSKSADVEIVLPETPSRMAGPDGPSIPASVQILCGGQAVIRLLAVEDFPAVREIGETCAVIDARSFAEAVIDVVPAASQDSARPILTGVLVEIGQRASAPLTLVATDSYRLHLAELRADCEGEHRFLVPGRSLGVAARMIGKALGKKGEGYVAIRAEEGAIQFDLPGGARLVSRLIEGEFPNYRQLVPDVTAADYGRLDYDLEDFLSALDQVALSARESVPVKIELNGIVSVSSNAPELGESSALVNGSWSGEELSVAFSPSYLIPALRSMHGAPLYARDGLRPAAFVEDGRVALVMPVRLPAPVA